MLDSAYHNKDMNIWIIFKIPYVLDKNYNLEYVTY